MAEHEQNGGNGEARPVEAATADIPDQRIVPSAPAGAKAPARWGEPFARFDRFWTRFETWLCAIVLGLEIVALTAWIALKGLSTAPDSSVAGIVFRALFAAGVLGGVGYLAGRRRSLNLGRALALAGVALGIFTARAWARVGVDWASNLLNWYQQGSALTLLGGLRGVGTRLTLLLALIGGSLATAAGKHVTIDLLTRFLKPRARVPVVIAGWLGAALVCFTASWGFFDHIAIENFEAKADASVGQKVRAVSHGLGEGAFIAVRQLDLDLETFPHVLRGEAYSEWLDGKRWNAWLDESGFADRYGAERVQALKLEHDAHRTPIVVIPDRGEAKGELVKATNLVVPIGLLILGIRFLLLVMLVLSGHRTIDPEAHAELGEPEVAR